MRKLAPIKEPVASLEQWSQRSKDERSAYRDMFNSVGGQLASYSDMAAHGGQILEDLKTWEILLQNKTLMPHTLDIIRTSLQFQHTLNIAFGRLSTSLTATVASKVDFYSKDPKEYKESKIKDDRDILRQMQESEDRYISVLENYWKCYVEFFRQGYQLGVMIKSFFVKLHPEDPVLIEVPKAFGKDLVKIWEDESDLRFAIYILKYFEEYGSLEEAVFKNNIHPDAVKSVIQALEKGTIPLTGSTEAMAHVLLHWVNSLTDSIFTSGLQKEFLEVANMVNMQQKKEKMSVLLSKLPRPNRIVILAVLRGCVKIAREKSVGSLRYTQILLEKIADLANALGPSLTRCSVEQVPLALALLRYLILNSELFFPLGCDEERIFVTETLKLGRVAKLAQELPPPPSIPTTPPLSPISPPPPLSTSFSSPISLSMSGGASAQIFEPTIPKGMKIGERNSSKNPTFGTSLAPSSSSPIPASYFSSSAPSGLSNDLSAAPLLSPSPSPNPSPSTPPPTIRTVGFKEPPIPPPRRTLPSAPTSPCISSSAPTNNSLSPLLSPSINLSLSSTEDDDSQISVTNNFITNNTITNNLITNNITNIIVDRNSPTPPSSSTSQNLSSSSAGSHTHPPTPTSPTPPMRSGSGLVIGIGSRPLRTSDSSSSISPSLSLPSSLPPASPATTPPTTPRKNTKEKPKKEIIDELQNLIANSNSDENDSDGFSLGHLGLGPLGPLAPSRVELTGPVGVPQESVQKLTRDVVTKIENIKAKAEQTDVFDDAFSLVLKLKIIIQDVEVVKSSLQMGMEFDKSELAKARGDKLARVRTTIQIFAREIIYVMETVCSIFNSSEIPHETRSVVATSLGRILAQLGNV